MPSRDIVRFAACGTIVLSILLLSVRINHDSDMEYRVMSVLLGDSTPTPSVTEWVMGDGRENQFVASHRTAVDRAFGISPSGAKDEEESRSMWAEDGGVSSICPHCGKRALFRITRSEGNGLR